MNLAKFERERYLQGSSQCEVQDLEEVRSSGADSAVGLQFSAIEVGAAREAAAAALVTATPKKSRSGAKPSPSPEAAKAAAAKVNALSQLAEDVEDQALKFTMKKRSFLQVVKTKADSFMVSEGVVFEALYDLGWSSCLIHHARPLNFCPLDLAATSLVVFFVLALNRLNVLAVITTIVMHFGVMGQWDIMFPPVVLQCSLAV